MNLKEQGWRFVLCAVRGWVWKHPAEVAPSDIDATDLTDDEFSELVRNAA